MILVRIPIRDDGAQCGQWSAREMSVVGYGSYRPVIGRPRFSHFRSVASSWRQKIGIVTPPPTGKNVKSRKVPRRTSRLLSSRRRDYNIISP